MGWAYNVPGISATACCADGGTWGEAGDAWAGADADAGAEAGDEAGVRARAEPGAEAGCWG